MTSGHFLFAGTLIVAAVGSEEPVQRDWALASTEEVSWEDAAAACEALEHDGADDWRLPSLSELTLHSSTIPPDLRALLRDRQMDVWACNPLEQPRPVPSGVEREEIARLDAEQRELERMLCELEGVDCSDRLITHRWQFSFVSGTPHHGRLATGTALCVRGTEADCDPDDGSGYRCLTTANAENWTNERHPDAVIEGIADDGSGIALGRSNDDGIFCLAEERVRRLTAIMACDGSGCGATILRDESRLPPLFVDQPSIGTSGRRNRLCVSLREGIPICGAEIEGVLDTGAVAQFGKTGPGGRKCVRRKRLEDVSVLLACVSGTCRAVPRDLFASSREVVLSLPPFYASRVERKGACPETWTESHNHR